MTKADTGYSPLPTTTTAPRDAQQASWDTYLEKNPRAGEPDEKATTATVRLVGHTVQIMTGSILSDKSRAKGWRFRLVRDADDVVLFDCGRFGPKTAYRHMLNKAIEAQFEVVRRMNEKATKA